MGVSHVESQLSEPSRKEILAKYFLHGLVFSLAMWPAHFAGWMFLALGGFLLGGISSIIYYLIVGMTLAWINVSICHWLWDLDVQETWTRLLIHGIILNVMTGIYVFLGLAVSQMLIPILTYEVYVVLALVPSAVLLILMGYLYKAVGALFLEP
jgi:hypothetical protein